MNDFQNMRLVLLLYLGIPILMLTLVYFFFSRGRNSRIINKRFPYLWKIMFYSSILTLGVGLANAGLFLTRVESYFIGAFLFATGIQIILWLLGIRLEILSNVPSNEDE